MEELKDIPRQQGGQYGARYKKRRRRPDIKAIAIFILLITVVILAANVIRLSNALKDDEQYISAQSSRVFEYYGEKDVIKLDDPTYGDTWLAALTDVPRHTLDYDKVETKNGYKHYYENGERLNTTGIDVSYHQGDIDWEAVRADGVDFAMIRLGYRGYESGRLNLDERFHEYAKGALDAGLEIGVYFYSQAINASEAEEEARFVLNELSDYKITYPVVFDWEIVGDDTARTNSVSSEELNECASVFCNTIARGGYIPMIYSVKRMALLKYDLSRLAGFDFWLAEYRDEPEFPYEFAMWQYASDGKVSGIEGEVDLNMSFVDYSKVRR